jgi:anti-sigma factor RsiW
MDPHLPDPLTDAELHALLDGAVQGRERALLQARLGHDAAGRERLAAWERQREALRALHAGTADEPVPQTLLNAAHGTNSGPVGRHGDPSWPRWGGMAAGVVLAFAAGWLTRGSWPLVSQWATRSAIPAMPAFVRDAAVAHVVYTPEQRHPVEVRASEEEHLVQWLSRRTGRPLSVPRLTALGYELVGGRLLPGEAGARAQFMYQNAQGSRLTLYLGALGHSAASAPDSSTAFRFASDGPVPAFYWVDQGFGYALSGALTREALLEIAGAVYRQL